MSIHYTDGDTHMAMATRESGEDMSMAAWLRYTERCERILGHDMDGTEVAHDGINPMGFSIDSMSAAFDARVSAEAYCERVKAHPDYIATKAAGELQYLVDRLHANACPLY